MKTLVSFAVSVLCALQLSQTSSADIITDWNSALLKAARVTSMNPPMFARAMAITHLAMFDALNAVEGGNRPYFLQESPPAGASSTAAVNNAALAAASGLFSTSDPAKAAFAEVYQKYASNPVALPGVDPGVAWGKRLGEAYLAMRANDGSTNKVSYAASADAGVWRPTLPANGAALLPGWGKVRPFALAETGESIPHQPPALNSAAYATEVNLTKAYGASNSVVRTKDQTEIALFWSDGAGTETPPGHWNHIAQDVSTAKNLSVAENARLFALLNMAMADAGIACWAAKYQYNLWRPITAIREAASDGNPDTEPDPNWLPLISTPPFPECTSGHSTFSRAAATVLARVFGSDQIAFTSHSDGLPGVTRKFTSFSQAADEAGISRIYGGIHFPTANIAGQACGFAIANQVLRYFLQPATALQFTAVARPAGLTRLSASVQPGQNYSIQASSDLNTWEHLGSASCADGNLQFSDPNAPGGRLRFYRLSAAQ